MPPTIGIDLGTTNSCCAVIEGGRPVVVVNQEGTRTTPSVVAFGQNSELLVGHPAKRQMVVNPKSSVFAVKRLMGRSYFSDVVQQARSHYPYDIVEGDSRDAWVQLDGRKFSPPEISSKILAKLRQAAERHTSGEVKDAVVTVPAYFDDRQRQATKDAGEIAGLNVVRIINEPTAAALAYGIDKADTGTVAVFDLGGGTFDISMLEVKKGIFHVLSTCGDTFLGGEDFDQEILKHFIGVCEGTLNMKLPKDPFVFQRLKEAAENAKHELSFSSETLVSIPFLTTGGGHSHSIQFRFARADMEKLVDGLVQRLAPFCQRAMSDAKLTPKSIDAVLLVGGMTRMPAVRRLAEQVFQKPPRGDINPDEAVAIGAAIQAGIISGALEKILLLDVTPLSLGIETGGGIFTKIIDRNTTIPIKRSRIFTTAYDQQPMVEVNVLQGEREMAEDNLSLGKFQLIGIPPSPRGVPQIEVQFEIDADGLVRVTARDLGTGQEQAIQVKSFGGLGRGEVERLQKEAEDHAQTDREKREAAEARNLAESILYGANKILADYTDKLDETTRGDLEKTVDLLETAMEKDDLAQVRELSRMLTSLVNTFASKLYETSPG
ncbi:MAG: molecular chaperone DnaK [Nitrospirae bacterium]|nr:molecular chaperone DnaK [Nitrospirota bacterium]